MQKILNKWNISVVVVVAALLMVAYIDAFLWWNFKTGFPFLKFLRITIHISLLLAWMISIHQRIIHDQVRRYSIYIAILMIFWIAIKTIKYSFIFDNLKLERLFWYFYYIPLLFIPTFGIIIALSLGKPESYKLPKRINILILLSTILLLPVLTNDFHNLVFVFPAGEILSNDNYSYGILFRYIFAWEIIAGICAVTLIIYKCRIPRSQTILWLPLLPLSLAIVYGILYANRVPIIRYFADDLTVTMCVFFVAIWESCVKSGLIQANTQYAQLLHATTIGAQITDEDFNVLYRSENAMNFHKENLISASTEALIFSKKGERLSGFPIQGGYVFWQEDISKLLSVLSDLESTGEELKSYGEILQEENRQKERYRKLEEQKRLFEIMREKTAPQKELIAEISKELENTDDEREAKKLLGKIAIVGAYIKRRSNLIFLAEQTDVDAAEELRLCLSESVVSLQLYGIHSALRFEEIADLDLSGATLFYDFFETALELSLDKISELAVSIYKKDQAFTFSLMLCGDIDCPALKRKFKDTRIKKEEDVWYCTLTVEKENKI